MTELPAARGWASWLAVSGLGLILVGAGHALEGCSQSHGGGHRPLLLDGQATWGVVHLLLGLVIRVTGLGLLAGLPAARAVT